MITTRDTMNSKKNKQRFEHDCVASISEVFDAEKEGWELIAVVQRVRFEDGGWCYEMEFYIKRPV